MIWKKTWFSYVLWALYSGILYLALALGIILLIPNEVSKIWMIGIVCLFFLELQVFTS